MAMINLKTKANRTDPLAWLAAGDQLDEAGEDGSQLRRAGYLLQAVLDLVMPVQDVMRWGIADGPPRRFPRLLRPKVGRYIPDDRETEDFEIAAVFRRATVDLFLWRKPVETGSTAFRATLRTSCLTRGELRGEESGVEYLVRRTLALLARLDAAIRRESGVQIGTQTPYAV